MERRWAVVCMLISLIPTSEGSHFRGAMIYWKQSPKDDNVIDIDYRQAWRRTSLSPLCNDAVKEKNTLMSNGQLAVTGLTSFANGGLSAADGVVSFDFQCTDFSISEDWTSGKGQANFTPSAFDNNTNIFMASFISCCWIESINDMPGSSWSMIVLINTTRRSDTGRINQSPRVDMAPIQRLQYGCNHTIRIPVTDADGDDIRCRWAESSLGYDECGDACQTFTHATIDERSCTITYGAQYKLGLYAVAVQIEDFSSKTSTTVLSSIPLQFLASVEQEGGSCENYEKKKPTFSGHFTLPDKACIGVKNNTDFTTDIYIDSKSNSSISELETVSPIGLVKSSLQRINATGTWHVSVKWNPNRTDTVNNVFCFTAVDSNGLSSEQRCVTILAGVPPAVLLPSSKIPSTSIVPRNQHQWSIEFDQFASPASRPAYMYLYLANGTLVETVDVYNDAGVTYTNGSHGTVLHFPTTTTLQGGEEYYFLFGQGLVEGRSYCGAESASVTDSSFWRFTVEPNQVTGVHVVCERQSIVIPCTEADFNCTETWLFINPCTKENILGGKTKFQHPLATNKFLLCDLSGKVYVAYCPPGENFYATCSQCATPGQFSQFKCGTTLASENPCTKENILAGKMFFAHPNSTTKFIHCDIWGHPWEQDCKPGHIWDQIDQTCIVPSIIDPCKQHDITGQTLFPHCDPHKYIHCDSLGQSFVQSCQLDYVFLTGPLTCVPPGWSTEAGNMKNTCGSWV